MTEIPPNTAIQTLTEENQKLKENINEIKREKD